MQLMPYMDGIANNVQLYLIHWPVAFTHGDGLFPKDPNAAGSCQLDKSTSITQTWKGKTFQHTQSLS